MKALVLAGGTGSRLRPLTFTGPKQLLPIANRPVLEYVIEDCAAAGLSDIGIVIGTKGRREIRERIGDGSRWGVDITYIVQGEPLGLAHAVGCGRDFVGDDPFIVYLGDVMLDDGIAALVDGFDRSPEVARIGVQTVENPSRYGIVEADDDGTLRDIVEKPDDPPSDLAAVGVYAFSSLVFEEIASLGPSWRGELELSDAIRRLVDRGERVRQHVIDGWWKDIGTPCDALEANRLVLRGETADERGVVHIGDGSVIAEGAVVDGPVSVGEGSVVRGDACLGPYTSIGDGCTVTDATVRSTVVRNDCDIRTTETISDSLIGSGVSIRDRSDGAVSVVVADDTRLEL